MMKFRLVTDVEFEAIDLQHACELIADHFLCVGGIADDPDHQPAALDMEGSMELKPKDQYTMERAK